MRAGSVAAPIRERVSRLKDVVCLNEMRAARTSGEFALRLGGGTGIDYKGLCGRLHSFSQKLRQHPLDLSVLPEIEANELLVDMEAMRARLEYEGAHEQPGPDASPAVDLPDPWQLLHLREDRTVDLDTAISEANKAARFSQELWERLNGVQHSTHTEHTPPALVAEGELGVGHARVERLLARAAEVLEAELQRASVAEWDVSGAQLRLSVAELALLEQQFAAGEELEGDVEEFAARLGIVESKEPQRWLEQNFEKAKTGFTFYTLGGQLLWQDVQYAANLVSRAAFSHYTLKPREVRTLQRAVKDVVVLVPFIIILLIPLSPIGHVLVFSFIQKFFPDFFPSTFTERRQNAVKIYQDIVPEADAPE